MAAPRLVGLAVLVVVVVSDFPRCIATAVSPSAKAAARGSCSNDDTRSCEVGDDAALRANSMLQMAKGQIKRHPTHAAVAEKVTDVPVAHGAGASRAAATPAATAKNSAPAAPATATAQNSAPASHATAKNSAPAAQAHDVHRHGSRHGSAQRGHAVSGKMADEDGAFSFIQTDDSLLETARVTDADTSDDLSSFEDIHVESRLIVKDEVRSPWRYGVGDAAALTGVLGFVFLLAAKSRPCVMRSARKACKARRQKAIEMPKPEPASLTSFGFQEPLLPQTGYTYSIPLAHHTEAGSSKPFCFNIPRRQDGPNISALVTCQQEGSTRAKVQLFAGEGGDFTSPLASCCLVHSTSDVESMNIQGAMMSWLSLLIDEKEDDGVTTGLDVSGNSQQSRVCTSLHGLAEDLMESDGSDGDASPGSNSGKDGTMRLEVKDSLGFAAGTLEAGPDSQCVLMRQGMAQFQIKVTPDSISLSKKDEIVALATHLGIRRNPELPELPELTGEDEHLQVDIRQGTTWTDVALFLNCILAVVVFKPKSIPKDADTEANDPKKSSLEMADIEPTTGAPQQAACNQPQPTCTFPPPQPGYYQRSGSRAVLLPTTPLVEEL